MHDMAHCVSHENFTQKEAFFRLASLPKAVRNPPPETGLIRPDPSCPLNPLILRRRKLKSAKGTCPSNALRTDTALKHTNTADGVQVVLGRSANWHYLSTWQRFNSSIPYQVILFFFKSTVAVARLIQLHIFRHQQHCYANIIWAKLSTWLYRRELSTKIN